MRKGEAGMNRKFMEMIKLLNIYLNHFPKFEKYALANNIRNTAYELYDLITECNKRYFKKTTITNLDIVHQKLRMQIYLANELGYFAFINGKKRRFVRKHSIYKMKRAIKKLKLESIISLIGHAKNTATITYYRRLLVEFQVLNLLPIRSQKCLFM